MFVKMKYRWYSYIYMHEIDHYEKKMFLGKEKKNE